MKKKLGKVLLVLTPLMAITAIPSTAHAASTGTWNGKFISSGSLCAAGYTGCDLKIDVGPLDCRPFIGKDWNRCVNEGTTRDYRYVVVWREAPVRYCTAFGVADKSLISKAGVISKLNGAKVTVSYGSLSNDKTDFVRCNS